MATADVYTDQPRTSRRTLASWHRPACALWLLVAAVETAIAVPERWPAQFAGKGDPSKITTQWITKGTALSPPLFLLAAMAVAVMLLLLARPRAAVRAGAALAGVVGAISIVGALGEVLAATTPAVPSGVHAVAIIGVIISAAVVVTAAAFLRTAHG